MSASKVTTNLFALIAGVGLAGTALFLSGDASANEANQTESMSAVAASSRFEIKVTPPEKVKAGKASSYTVTVVPKGEWHVNLDFPTKLVVKDTAGVTYPKAQLRKGDASTFNASKLVFDVPFTASKPGKTKLTADITFSVCIDTQCAREKEAVETTVKVVK